MSRMKLTLIGVFLLIVSASPTLAQTKTLEEASATVTERILEQITGDDVGAIAVPPLANSRDEITRLGTLASDTLAEQFVIVDGPRVIDRGALAAIQQELELRADGFVDASDATAVGRAAGVDAILLGRLIETDNTSRLSVRLVSVSNAEILAAASAEFISGSPGLNAPIIDANERVSSGRVFNDAGLIWTVLDLTFSPCPNGYGFANVEVCARLVVRIENRSDQDVSSLNFVRPLATATDRGGAWCEEGALAGLPMNGHDFPRGSSQILQIIEIKCSARLDRNSYWAVGYQREFEGDRRGSPVSASFEY